MNSYSSLFEQQSYLDALNYYQEVLDKTGSAQSWDYVVLTASNEAQANAYQEQIDWRLRQGVLPQGTRYAVLPDPDGKRVGSGGATLNVIRYLREKLGEFSGTRTLVIHSGGDSKRVPQYSACGKLFSPVPRVLPDGRRSTLFDEFMIGMSTVVPRLNEGMLICSGDVLLLFNALQIDYYGDGAAAFSIKESVQTGKDHGVFLKDADGNVGAFLHKQTVEALTKSGAVDPRGKVDIDTGAVLFSPDILETLWKLVESESDFRAFVNERARLSFYGDFLYPLASGSTLEQFYREKPEGDLTPELHECRTAVWNALHTYSMKLIQFAPASFIHFGTTHELRSLVTERMERYRFLGWSGSILSNVDAVDYAVSNSYISRKATVDTGSYIEDCYIHAGTHVGKNCVLSGVTLSGQTIPDGTVLHGLKLAGGKFVARLYGVDDNPKENTLLGRDLGQPLWSADIYPVCGTIEEAVKASIGCILEGRGFSGKRTSLCRSFRDADVTAILPWQEKLGDKVRSESILQSIDDRVPVKQAVARYAPINRRTEQYLRTVAEKMDEHDLIQFGRKIRIYYFLSLLADPTYADACFGTICQSLLDSAIAGTAYREDFRIASDEIVTRLPVRVNWGGGWSDTPPYCLEFGGTVLNAAISFDGVLPIEVTIRKLPEHEIVLASTDIGSHRAFSNIKELQNCRNPSDPFALHKAALIACGVIPHREDISVETICRNLGGGLYLNTRVINIPKGSGLGTSSILAGACVKAIYRFMGIRLGENDLYNRVLCMEQLMSTGGGWQDQVGGLAPGIKMVTSAPGLKQKITCTPVNISRETLQELDRRFCLVYTGQRRLARNLLRDVVGNYIGSDPDSVDALYRIQQLAVLMRFELEKGNVDAFAKLLNQHWEQSLRLGGCTNTCIDQIFLAIDDMIDGKMVCGAGGGGFLQVVLKKGVSVDALNHRLHEVFQESGVDARNCRFEM